MPSFSLEERKLLQEEQRGLESGFFDSSIASLAHWFQSLMIKQEHSFQCHKKDTEGSSNPRRANHLSVSQCMRYCCTAWVQPVTLASVGAENFPLIGWPRNRIEFLGYIMYQRPECMANTAVLPGVQGKSKRCFYQKGIQNGVMASGNNIKLYSKL